MTAARITAPALRRACERHGIAASRFGVNAARDPRLIFDMERGRKPRRALLGRITAYLASLEGR